MDRRLFNNEDFSNFLRSNKERAKSYVNDQLPIDYIISNDESEIVEKVYEKYKAEKIVLQKDRIGKPSVNHKERKIEIKIPYTGNPYLLDLKPSTFRNVNPIMGVTDQYPVDGSLELSIIISVNEDDDVGKTIDSINKTIQDISKQCDDYNEQILKYIEMVVKNKRNSAIKLENMAKEADNILQEKFKNN